MRSAVSAHEHRRGPERAAVACAPVNIVQVQKVQNVGVRRRLLEVDLHELHRVGVDARPRLADERQQMREGILLGPAQRSAWIQVIPSRP